MDQLNHGHVRTVLVGMVRQIKSIKVHTKKFLSITSYHIGEDCYIFVGWQFHQLKWSKRDQLQHWNIRMKVLFLDRHI